MSSKDGKKPSNSKPQIRTLADLNRRPPPSSDGGDDDAPQEYYTGGEKSGMLVQDPTKGANDVDAIFEQAMQMGALPSPSQDHASSSRSFTGTGRLLSGETVPSATPQQPEVVLHTITFWMNGFTVNDGQLRRFDDPENIPFLESIRRSECPKELEVADRTNAVHVKLIRKNENYSQPVIQQVAFQGVGRSLGSTSSKENPASESTSTARNMGSIPSAVFAVDDSLPSTSIQLRLADGTRMVARFNLHHTVGHIRAFIDASRPEAATSYRLRTSEFPPKQLTDSATTIEQAGLANSVVIQSL